MHFSIKTLMAAVAVSACAAAFAADMPKSISITYVKAPFNLQNIVMKERGMLEKAFEKDGVKIEWRVINSGALQGQAMASGDLDFSAVMNTASLLMAAGAGNPIAVATGVAHPKEIFAMVGRPGTNFAVKDLKGKKVAGPKGTVLHQLLIKTGDIFLLIITGDNDTQQTHLFLFSAAERPHHIIPGNRRSRFPLFLVSPPEAAFSL